MAEKKIFEASPEAKGKAKQLRLFAFLAWLIAIAGEIYAITQLLHDDKLVWLIVAIVVILALAITGSTLWKKANRLDPASEQNKFKFFVQNQLGAIMAVLAFLPLVIFIFTNKDLDKKTKGIAGTVGVIALLIAGISGVDFDPPSVEKYTEEINAQTAVVTELTDTDNVYWAKSGTVNHIYEDCQHIRGRDGVTHGTVKESFEAKGISTLCKTCENRAVKAKEERLLDLSNPREITESGPFPVALIATKRQRATVTDRIRRLDGFPSKNNQGGEQRCRLSISTHYAANCNKCAKNLRRRTESYGRKCK